jgi:hypothetical protein
LKFLQSLAVVAVVLFVSITMVGTANAVIFEPGDSVNVPNGKSVFFGDHAISVSRTNSTGNGSGNYLFMRGFDGIVMASKGTGAFGTGQEGLRIDQNGNIKMANAKSLSWVDQGISITRANSNGDGVGSFLQLRGFSGITFKTGGTGFFGTGNEEVRITSVGMGIGTNPIAPLDVNGNIRLTGNIVSPNDICIGTCP